MMDKNIPNLSLASQKASTYSQVDGLSLQNLFYAYNEFFPNCYMFTSDRREGHYYIDTDAVFKALTAAYDDVETIQYFIENVTTKKIIMSFCILLRSKNIFARLERSLSESYVLFDNSNYDDMIEFKNIIMKSYMPIEAEKNNLFTISHTQHGFELIKNPIKDIKDFDIVKQYNDDFVSQDAKIQKFIKKNDTAGIIMLHGTKGTGKSTYIRHLINTNPDKKFVFIPSGLVEMLGKPEFQSFLLSLSNHIIILEDCEPAIKDRKTNMYGSSAVSILLNMSDGLLADGLGIKFICTFNADIRDIDEAISRKGRLAVKYEFKPLTVEKSNALLREVYIQKLKEMNAASTDGEYDIDDISDDIENNTEEFVPDIIEEDVPTTNKPMTLADIYYYDDETYVTERKKII